MYVCDISVVEHRWD